MGIDPYLPSKFVLRSLRHGCKIPEVAKFERVLDVNVAMQLEVFQLPIQPWHGCPYR
jgi:hypothetical protein